MEVGNQQEVNLHLVQEGSRGGLALGGSRGYEEKWIHTYFGSK